MAINSHIIDPTTGQEATIGEEGDVLTSSIPYPPNVPVHAFPYISYFTLNADGSSIDMGVDGSTTAQEFRIDSDADDDIYITTVSFLLTDSGMTNWNEFGNIAALGTGCSFEWRSSKRVTTFGSGIKTNFLLASMCIFGGLDWYRATMRGLMKNAAGASEGLFTYLDFRKFGLPYGIRLRANSKDKLIIIINDDLSTAGEPDDFEAKGYGFRRAL